MKDPLIITPFYLFPCKELTETIERYSQTYFKRWTINQYIKNGT